VKIVTCIVCAALAALLFSARGVSQSAEKQGAPKEREMFATNRLLSKGGIGIVNTSLYIVVKSPKSDSNELIVTPTQETEERWKGKSITKPEVVFVYQGKVWPAQSLPDRFDLSKAVVVSFEGDKIRFFDFQAMSGGYYARISE
jgi:hypothetical protein